MTPKSPVPTDDDTRYDHQLPGQAQGNDTL